MQASLFVYEITKWRLPTVTFSSTISFIFLIERNKLTGSELIN